MTVAVDAPNHGTDEEWKSILRMSGLLDIYIQSSAQVKTGEIGGDANQAFSTQFYLLSAWSTYLSFDRQHVGGYGR
jgi:hypothetical protein